MTFDLVVKNGKIVTTEGIFQGGVAIDKGKIVMVAADSALPSADKTIDVKGNYLFPGVIDPHTHLGIYSGDFELEFKTETAAAAHGGTTTVMHCIISKQSHNVEIPKLRAIAEKNIIVDLTFYASIGTPQQIQELGDYIKQGVTSFKFFLNRPEYESMFGAPSADDGMLYTAWKKLRELGGMPMCHCENFEIARMITEDLKSKKPYPGMWNDCRPGFCEYESMQKAAFIAKIARSPVYIVHMSIGDGVDIAMRARQEGVEMYIETCPHYLTLQANDPKLLLLEKVCPPLRTKADNEKLWWGLKAGYIQCIGTDHTANKKDMKMGKGDFWSILLDWPSIETMFPVVLTEGLKRDVPLEKLAEVCSYNTARIHGIPSKGAIKVGNDADIVVLDLKNKVKLKSDMLVGWGDWSLFEGWELIWPTMTISNGNIVVENGKVVGKPGMGKFVKRIPRTPRKD